jgi:hypothetical protein
VYFPAPPAVALATKPLAPFVSGFGRIKSWFNPTPDCFRIPGPARVGSPPPGTDNPIATACATSTAVIANLAIVYEGTGLLFGNLPKTVCDVKKVQMACDEFGSAKIDEKWNCCFTLLGIPTKDNKKVKFRSRPTKTYHQSDLHIPGGIEIWQLKAPTTLKHFDTVLFI